MGAVSEDSDLSLGGIDGAAAVVDDPRFFKQPCIVKAEVGTGTQIAVELLHLMTFGMRGIKGTEVRFIVTHGIKFEVIDDRIAGDAL